MLFLGRGRSLLCYLFPSRLITGAEGLLRFDLAAVRTEELAPLSVGCLPYFFSCDLTEQGWKEGLETVCCVF